MEQNVKPKLRKVRVPVNELLLDPNNPRFMTDTDTSLDEKLFPNPGEQIKAAERMIEFQVAELEKSIRCNGWQPVDMMFVRRLPSGQFVVVEGNRRLSALQKLLRDDSTPKDLRTAVDPLEVLEVVGSPETIAPQITYLLGVRHHGALIEWKPFAQAHNIYERYLRSGGMTNETFRWEETIADEVATTLGMPLKRVKERIQVYRVMKQLDELPEVKPIGIQGQYYSLIQEAISGRRNSPLRQYLPQDQSTFLMSEDTLHRLASLCRFSEPDRQGAPITKPSEWRSLERILKDHNPEVRARMLAEVEIDSRRPSDVYAERAAELRTPRWDQWLKEVTDVLRRIPISDLDDTREARAVAGRLARVLDSLPSGTADEVSL